MEYTGKRKQTLDLLTQRTLENKLNWKADADENSFSVVMESGYIVRAMWPRSTCSVSVMNSEGTELFNYVETANELGNGVIDLWRAARENALGIDEAMDSILSELG